MAAKEGKQFLVVLRLKPFSFDRMSELGVPLMRLLQSISAGPVETFFRSECNDLLGFFIRSKLKTGQIRAAIETPEPKSWEHGEGKFQPFLTNKDHIAVVQIGPEYNGGEGFTRALNWILHH